jgi:hypothetical protein
MTVRTVERADKYHKKRRMRKSADIPESCGAEVNSKEEKLVEEKSQKHCL